MKLVSYSLLGAAFLFIVSCSNTTRFPVSSVAPAADIRAKTKTDDNNNKIVKINAKNLASPERINPSSTAFVVWGETDQNEIRNLGQLQNKNAQNATFETVTPYEINEIFITAEPQGSVNQPTGTEISRVELPEDVFEAPVDDMPVIGNDENDNTNQNQNQDQNQNQNQQGIFQSQPDTTNAR